MRTPYIYRIIIALIIILFTQRLAAQTPYINSISPSQAGAGEKVNIVGSNLPTSDVVVFFGGAMATEIEASASLIIATVPYGATFDQVSVINTTTGVITYSQSRFINSFEGQSIEGNELSTNLGNKSEFATSKTQSQDLCTCDFDQDGDLDIVVSNVGSTDINVFTNTTTDSGTPSFTSSLIQNTRAVTNVVCGDLDGDGYPDLAANEFNAEAQLYIYRNQTASAGGADNIVFDDRASQQAVKIPNDSEGLVRKPGRLAIGDLDLDGHPELVAVVEDENLVYIFENNTDRGVKADTISFVATPVILEASANPGSAGLGGLDLADLNNDGLLEIITSNFGDQGFYIFQNNSQPSNLSFLDPQNISTNADIRAIKAGDLNNDGFAEIVLTNSEISVDIIEIIENQTAASGDTPAFGTAFQIIGVNTSWGLDLGDIDGDGDLDISVASFGSNNFYGIMNINPSVVEADSYDVAQVATGNNSRNIKIADIDSDGKPDFVFTHRSTSEATGFLGVKLNSICYNPTLVADGSTRLCSGETVDLVAPLSEAGYVWRKDGTPIVATSRILTVTEADAGSYTVTIDDACDTQSNAILVESLAETFAQPSFIFSDATPCIGDNISLTVTADPNTIKYTLTGPNDLFVDDFDPATYELSISDLSTAGQYKVITESGTLGCQSTSDPANLEVVALPTVTITNDNPDQFCEGTTVTLSATNYAGYAYDWKFDDGSGAVSAGSNPEALVASAAGEYAITIIGSGCESTSPERTLSTIAPPTSSFTTDVTELCEGAEIEYTATSTGTGGISIVNNWNFGDASPEQSGDNLNYAHSSSGTYTISLTAGYEGIDNCPYTPATQDVNITATPSGAALDLIVSSNSDPANFEKCAEDGLLIRVDDIYQSYEWKTTDGTVLGNNPSIVVASESEVTIALIDALECSFDATPVSITNYTGGGINISTLGTNLVDGDTVFLDKEDRSVELTTDATDPVWSPSSLLNTANSTDIEAYPVSALTWIYVEGSDMLGCLRTDSVVLKYPGVQAMKNFTPNGDGYNDCWQIYNISTASCTVKIFDSKGRRIKEINIKPDLGSDDCIWDGRSDNGTELPTGTYYYIMDCQDGNKGSGGAILLAR